MTRETAIVSITRDDFDIQFFRAGGKGGQKQNKTSSACRIVHRESGAVGESRRERSQAQNKKLAFRHCVESQKFQLWLKLKVSATVQGLNDIDHRVDEAMAEKNLRVETRQDGKWVEN